MRNKQMILNKRLKETKAITLIALVITIVVLLILAGVSISALMQNHNLLNKAGEAKIKDEDSREFDLIKLAVANVLSRGADEGIGTKSNLKSALEGIIKDEVEGEEKKGPWTVTGKDTGKKYQISNGGSIKELSE